MAEDGTEPGHPPLEILILNLDAGEGGHGDAASVALSNTPLQVDCTF